MAARSLNRVTIIGNLTRDPEMRYTAKGTPLVTFGVATNRSYTPSGATESIEEAEFHNVVAWGKLAELCQQLLGKGQKVFIEGRLSTRSWEDEASNKRMYRTEIVAEEMIVLSPPKTGGVGGGTDKVAAAAPVAEEATPSEKPEKPEEPVASDQESEVSGDAVSQDVSPEEVEKEVETEKGDTPF